MKVIDLLKPVAGFVQADILYFVSQVITPIGAPTVFFTMIVISCPPLVNIPVPGKAVPL
jgi:hypothetical protein